MEDSPRRAQLFFQEQGFSDYSFVTGAPIGWRCRAKLAVRQVKQKIVIGLFEEGSHNIVSAETASAHHPQINKALKKLKDFLIAEGITAYNEKTHRGDVRYLQCVVERRTERVQVAIVLNTSFDSHWGALLKSLFQKDPLLWHSFWINIQPKPTNTIFGSEWHHVVGERFVWESICGLEVPFLPSHFGQANPEMFERLLEDMKVIFPRDQVVGELFAGMGIISLVLRPMSRSIILYEKEASSKESFQELLRKLPPSLQKGCEFIIGDAHAAHDVCERASAIIVDPPRKGLCENLVKEIIEQKNIRFFLYISCCWKTFERDAQKVLCGGFCVKWAKSYQFFPGTNHLETMCLFLRK